MDVDPPHNMQCVPFASTGSKSARASQLACSQFVSDMGLYPEVLTTHCSGNGLGFP